MKNNSIRIKSILILTVLLIMAFSFRPMAAGISRKRVTLSAGESTKVSVSGAKKVTWKSTNKKVATVTKKGIIKAKKAGSCKIRAKAGIKTFTCRVKVTKNTASASVSGSASGAAAASTWSISGMTAQEKEIYNAMVSLRSEYPEGKKWTNSDYYAWNGGLFRGGYGCAAFAFRLSDEAFGDSKAVKHTDPGAVRVGDILRVDNNTHMVIVLAVTSSGVIVAEGNYNSSIHWGRKISNKELKSNTDYILTRY